MLDLDTFLTTLYVVVDEYDKTHPLAHPPMPGPAPALTRSEVVTLAIFAQWACFASERAFYRYAQHHLRAAFPRLPDRSQYNRELRQAHDLLVRVGQWLGRQTMQAPCAYEVLDGMGLPTRNVHRRGAARAGSMAPPTSATVIGWGGITACICSPSSRPTGC